EIAMRYVLGAGRGRLLRQLLVETLILVAAAAALGAWMAYLGRRLFERIELPSPLPPLLDLEIQFSPAVIGFVAAAVIVTTLLAGLFPAWRTTRAEPGRELAGSGRSVGEGRSGLRAALTGLQVAFSMLLLVLAGLFMGALQRAADVDIGYRVDDVYVAGIDLRRIGYDHGERVALVDRYIEAVAADPALEVAGAASVVPLNQSRQGLGDFLPADGEPVETDVNVVAGDFFDVLEMPVRGRKFDERDRFGGEGVAIVNETLASRLAPDGDVIGQVIDYGGPGDSRPLRIIGVAPDARYASLSNTGVSFVYLPYAQTPGVGMHLLTRSGAGRQAVDRRLAEIQNEVDPDLLRPRVDALADVAAVGLLPQKIAGGLATTLGMLGCILAAIGLYGMLAQLVAAHVQEIGVRQALGASPAAIRRRMAWIGARPAILGALVGIGLAGAAAMMLDGFLFGVRGTDGLAFLVALAVLAAVCAVALMQPALRAARVLPSEALRDE
ncbi:MAG: ABC transporter permease, partial [Candidatus Wenzhouxiangella sp. M2_3B_020]